MENAPSMFDVNRILDALQNDPNTQRTAMGVGGGAAAGLAAGMLMGKSGRKMLGKAAKYGAVAALGGLAYHAWNRSRQPAPAGASGVPSPSSVGYEAPPAGSPFALPHAEAEQDALGQALVRAMIAAAKADGKIDADEKARILERLNAMDLDASAKAFVFDELSAPLGHQRRGGAGHNAGTGGGDLRRLPRRH